MVKMPPQPDQPQDGAKMAPEPIRTLLAKELNLLRAREGLTYERMKDCGTLTNIASRWKNSQGPDIQRLDDALAAIEMIKRQLALERPAAYRDSLQVCYGILVDGTSRDERVRRYLSSHPDRIVHSDSSLERYAKAMVKQLAVRLTTAGGFANDAAPAPQLDLHDEESENYLTRLSLISLVRFGPNRTIRDLLYLSEVAALTPGEHKRHVSWEYFSDPKEGVVEIAPEFGCEGAALQYENGVASMWLTLPWLDAGERHRYSWRAEIRSEIAADPPMLTFTPRHRLPSYELWLQFFEDARPTRCWAFTKLTHYDVRRVEMRRQTFLTDDQRRVVHCHWEELSPGLTYGITWDWASG